MTIYDELVARGLIAQVTDEEEIKELIKKNTRNYAKRQITFFKRMQNHISLSPDEIDVENIIKNL